MKKFTNLTWAVLVVAASLGLTSCKKEFSANGDYNKSTKAPIDYSSLPEVHLSGVYTSTRVLSPDSLYLLDGAVYFSGNNANLYIKAGTHVVTGSPVSYGGQSLAGVLVVTKGAQIFADGNKTNTPLESYNPDSTIVFGPHPDNLSPVPGDFGGVILLGDASTNVPTSTTIEGIPSSPPADVTYGGSDDTDNSGVMRFVRIEYAGFELTTDNEINGLTLGGVGSGTTLNHIQVSRSDDDSFEFFGGTVNADHLIALAGTDDDFDFDNGYSGTLSYCIALKDPGSPHTVSGGVSDANGIESDNNAASNTNSPITRPTVDHFTILGYASTSNVSQLEKGAHFRRNSGVNVQNSIIGGYNTGVNFESPITATGSAFQYNVVQAYSTLFNPASGTGLVPAIFANNQSSLGSPAGSPANDYLLFDGGDDAFYNRLNTSYGAENLVPSAGSPAEGGGIIGTDNGAFAVGASSLWTANWTKFNF